MRTDGQNVGDTCKRKRGRDHAKLGVDGEGSGSESKACAHVGFSVYIIAHASERFSE